jgi:hypothetical protein
LGKQPAVGLIPGPLKFIRPALRTGSDFFLPGCAKARRRDECEALLGLQ